INVHQPLIEPAHRSARDDAASLSTVPRNRGAANGARRLKSAVAPEHSKPAIRIIRVWAVWSGHRCCIVCGVRRARSCSADDGACRDTCRDPTPAITSAVAAAVITADVHIAVALVEGAIAAADVRAVASGEIGAVAPGEVSSTGTRPAAASAAATAAAGKSTAAATATATTTKAAAAAPTAATAAPTAAAANQHDRRVGLYRCRGGDIWSKAAVPDRGLRGGIGSQQPDQRDRRHVKE